MSYRICNLVETLRSASLVALLAATVYTVAGAQPAASQTAPWQVPQSSATSPHFEQVNGHPILYVDGQPFTALASEIPWWDLIVGQYKETEGVYDYLYPAAARLGLNSLKVPVKWSMVEPKEGVYDFSYIDHVKAEAEKNHLKLILDWFGHYASGDGTIYHNLTNEAFAPLYVIEDEKTYPRAVDADGVAHHNAISYEYDAVIQHEIRAFSAFMDHIKQVDGERHTIIMIQVENEIAVFGEDRKNRKLWRDHSAAANANFKKHGVDDELKYSAWQLSTHWIQPLTEAGAKIYPLPFIHNFVGGVLEDAIVGGAPGEDVSTYLEHCPRISLIGLNLYADPDASVVDLRQALIRYKVGRNMPSLTETNSGTDPVAPRLAYIAVGEFGSPIFAPWAINVSYPAAYSPYVTPQGELANGAGALRDTYVSLEKAIPQIAYYAGTDKLKVFMSNAPGQKYTQTQEVNGFNITVAGDGDSKAIVIHPEGNRLLIIGYHCGLTVNDLQLRWPQLKTLHVSKGQFVGNEWRTEGEPLYSVNQSTGSLGIDLDVPEAVLVSW